MLSIFVQDILPRKSNLIVGYIYWHPCMDRCTFNDHYLTPLLTKLPKEANKTIILPGNSNIHLLSFDKSKLVITFYDCLASNSLKTETLLSTRISNNSKTQTDNIFCSTPNPLERYHQVCQIILNNSLY